METEQTAEQPTLPEMEEFAPSDSPVTQEVIDALRASNENRIRTIQRTVGQTMDPIGIFLMTMIDHAFTDDARLQFLFDLETRISQSLDEFESQSPLLIAQQQVPSNGINDLF
ncbi:hypothetical protein UFOVP238_8 [uncultured Caudovirales phage]|uniref:Uncharacterized protein n=1 Tax=uncultured Caudovirales phage TaxID=2100421 RepID=A0A6J7WVU2_9CAUD|nr:hypothetical protein UFOVP238_8 [uncultured Caudovirales phage]